MQPTRVEYNQDKSSREYILPCGGHSLKQKEKGNDSKELIIRKNYNKVILKKNAFQISCFYQKLCHLAWVIHLWP